jgi:hypothetical protein
MAISINTVDRTALSSMVSWSAMVLNLGEQSTIDPKFKAGKYHCTVDLLFDWFGLACFANKN